MSTNPRNEQAVWQVRPKHSRMWFDSTEENALKCKAAGYEIRALYPRPADARVPEGWRCNACGSAFNASDANWKSNPALRLAPNCPKCKAWNQYTYPASIGGLIDKLEHYGFQDGFGHPLATCAEWIAVKSHAMLATPPAAKPALGAQEDA